MPVSQSASGWRREELRIQVLVCRDAKQASVGVSEEQFHNTLSELPAPHLTGDRDILHASVRHLVEFPRRTRHSLKEAAGARYRAAGDLNN